MKTNTNTSISRGEFLKASGTALVGLVVGFYIPDISLQTEAESGNFQANAFIGVSTSGEITVTVPKPEVGQGIRTALAMVAAEELDADWKKIRVEQAVAGDQYGDQVTGGSRSMIHTYMPLRRAAAEARARLITAAARIWDIDKETCSTRQGKVIHLPSNRILNYGELASTAAEVDGLRASDINLKETKDFRIIGRDFGVIDEPHIVDGTAIYGIDVKIPGMLYATLAMPPARGSRMISLNENKALSVPGVRRVIQIQEGIAVLAESTWAAIKGRRELDITWSEDGLTDNNSESSRLETIERFQQEIQQSDDPNMLMAIYEVPLLAHATMEPMNCVADVRNNRCEVWAPTQNPAAARNTAAGIVGIPRDSVTVHVTMIGGGFGRRLEQDYVSQAVRISQAARAPVQLVWTREDDMQHDAYHPMSVHLASANIENPQMPTIESARISTYTDLGNWRAVENFTAAFVRECFLDELAVASGRDPYELRLELEPESLQSVLDVVAQATNWDSKLPDGWGRGIACHSTWNSTPVAEVAEVYVAEDGSLQIKRVVCAVDCGLPVNPNLIKAQVEGGIAWASTAVLKQGITVVNGHVQQSNFDDYPILRFNEMPIVEVHILPSEDSPRGVGEAPVPPLAPAVLNAIHAATGVRIRRLPIDPRDLR